MLGLLSIGLIVATVRTILFFRVIDIVMVLIIIAGIIFDMKDIAKL